MLQKKLQSVITKNKLTKNKFTKNKVIQNPKKRENRGGRKDGIRNSTWVEHQRS